MNSILEIPEDVDAINRWIEELVLSSDFSTLVGQLDVINELADDKPTFTITEDELNEIVDSGMGDATADQCRALLRSPGKLVELHQRIFESGSGYWIAKIKDDSSDSQFLSKLSKDLFAANKAELASSDVAVETTSIESQPIARSTGSEVSNTNRPLRRLISLAAVLACLGLGIYFVLGLSQADSSDWGWQSAMSMPDSSDPSDYLNSLSRSGLEWFDQDRSSPAKLAARLDDFSSGCQRLIDAPHSSLSEQDRSWLLEKCQAWKVKIDQLASSARGLGSGSDAEFERIKDSADDLASKIGLLISRRAESI